MASHMQIPNDQTMCIFVVVVTVAVHLFSQGYCLKLHAVVLTVINTGLIPHSIVVSH